MTTVNSYLTFNGNCEKVFNFYKTAFKSEFEYIGRFKDMPADSNFEVTETDKEKITHVSLPIGNTTLMGSDVSVKWIKKFKQGNNFSVSILTDSKEEADRLFQVLSENGKITTPMEHTFWDAYFGMFTDQFGIQWMINFDKKNNSINT